MSITRYGTSESGASGGPLRDWALEIACVAYKKKD